MKVGHTNHRPELLQQEENRAVLNESLPVAIADEPALLSCQLVLIKQLFGCFKEALAPIWLNQLMKETIQSIALVATLKREWIRTL
ncbi:hypothetical protein D3C84_896650 [compost metagenome]